MATLTPVQGDLLAGVAAQSSDTIPAPGVSLFAGDYPAISVEYLPAAAGHTFVANQVVGFDGAGKLAPAEYASVAGVKATGTLTFAGVGTAADTVTISGRVYTLVAALTGAADEVLIGGSVTASALNMKNAINADPATLDITHGSETDHPSVIATSAAGVVTVTANAAGTGANAVTTTESGSGTSWGAATMAGGSNPSNTGVQAIGIVTYAPSAVTTDGSLVGVYRTGNFNMDRLVYDASYSTNDLKRFAFQGAPAPTNIIVQKLATMTIA